MNGLPDHSVGIERPYSCSVSNSWVVGGLAITGVFAVWATNRKVAWIARGLLVFGALALAQHIRRLSRPQFEWIQLSRHRPRHIEAALVEWKKDMDLRPHFRLVKFADSRKQLFVSSGDDSKVLGDGWTNVSLDTDDTEAVLEDPQRHDSYKEQALAWQEQVQHITEQMAPEEPIGKLGLGALWADGLLQAVVLVEKDHQDMNSSLMLAQGDKGKFYVVALATAPWNLARKETGDSSGRRRAGRWATPLLQKTLVHVFGSREDCEEVLWDSVPECAKGFFEGLGGDQEFLSLAAVQEFCFPQQEESLGADE